MEVNFQCVTKFNKYLPQTVQKSSFNGKVVYVAMWESADENGEVFIASTVYKGVLFEKLLDDGVFIKL